MNTINCKGRLISVDQPIVMGILNVTPDSFFDGGRYDDIAASIDRVAIMIEEGATIIDVGGMSSRPGAEIIDQQEELSRVIPVIEAISKRFPDQLISIDTVHSSVARAAIEAGAHMINDISGGHIDPVIWDVARDFKVPYILMHMQGKPADMQERPEYNDVVLDILAYLRKRVNTLRAHGVVDIIIDPGFGFGKTVEQNYLLLKRLSVFEMLDCLILVGISRKSMLYRPLEITPIEALNATTAAHMIALSNGARILRVHDVKEAAEAVKIYQLAR